MADIRTKSSGLPLEREALDNQVSTGSNETGLNVSEEIKKLLERLGESRVEPVAYDTAWIARLGHVDNELATGAIEWLRSHQLPDGSWGAATPLYHHDRVISTLAAIIALTHYGAPEDQPRIRAALPALQHSLSCLDTDVAGRTVAFEMLLPSLFAEAKAIGLELADPSGIVHKMSLLRDAKLAKAPQGMISRQSTLGFSAEMVGPDGLHLLDVDNLQQPDGSVSVSAAATAFYAAYVRADSAVLRYLRELVRCGGAPAVTNIDVFEYAWGLWNFTRGRTIDPSVLAYSDLFLDKLAAAWHRDRGIAYSSVYSVQDGDDTGIVFKLFAQFGRTPELSALWHYEEETHFRNFALESHASISANIHILGALLQAGFEPGHAAVDKIVKFLHEEQEAQHFWADKWHSSPYYPTGHLVTIGAKKLDHLVSGAVDWIISTQNPDGSWGYYSPTAEETAYCLQALMTWYQQGHDVPRQVLTRACAWLVRHATPPYPPLWISKCLYSPTLVVHSAVLGALRQYESEFNSLP
jgi:halimadienyl-diphosphate synthase